MKTPRYIEESGMVFPPEWEIREIIIQGEFAGFWIIKENEIHCWRKPDYKGRWLTRNKIEELGKETLDKYGKIITKVTLNNETGHRFIKRLGFKEIHRDDSCVYYETERLNHARF